MGNTVALANSVLCQDSAKRQNKISSSSSHCWCHIIKTSINIRLFVIQMTPEELSGYRAISSFSPTAEVCWSSSCLKGWSSLFIIIIIASNTRLRLKAHCKKNPKNEDFQQPWSWPLPWFWPPCWFHSIPELLIPLFTPGVETDAGCLLPLEVLQLIGLPPGG